MISADLPWDSARHKTALHRKNMSKPVRLAFEDGLLSASSTFLDYGCGHGEDVRQLREFGVLARGWDPAFKADGDRSPAEIVNLGYVVNVIESPEERASVLKETWRLAERLLIVSVRSTLEDGPDEGAITFGDGCLTRIGSFQKFFDQHELRSWIRETLGEEPLSMAPGIFLVFRDEPLREAWRARRFRRRLALPNVSTRTRLFQEHRELLGNLMSFLGERGRLPVEDEADFISDLQTQFGSIKRSFQIVRSVTGEEPWSRIKETRKTDILVWLALCRFQIRPRFSALPIHLQRDIKAFFSAYTHACNEADTLLMSVGHPEIREKAIVQAPFGKLMPKGLYVHTDYLEELSPILRIYEGCARAFVGGMQQANLIKFHRDVAQISYLTYEDFEKIPHPQLMDSVVVSLDGRKIRRKSYQEQANRFILHRKETFVPNNHPLWSKFHRLTLQEERWGLYEEPSVIGTHSGWEKALSEKNCRLSGHRLMRVGPHAERSGPFGAPNG